MSDLWFTEDHEWVRIEDDDGAVVGITDYAQDQLGELVFVELPEVGAELDQGDEGAVIESVKAAGGAQDSRQRHGDGSQRGPGGRTGPGQRGPSRRRLVLPGFRSGTPPSSTD